jgi:2-keto-4-pentenoate hydratase/2-oxohepta-3-ene-1,7-dioic acid hydratase in catechol pathway
VLSNGRPRAALATGDRALILSELAQGGAGPYTTLTDAVDAGVLWSPESGTLVRELANRLADTGIPSEWDRFCRIECQWLPPVARPEKIICIGLNYKDHAAESNMELPKEPVFFNKYNNALVGAAGPVILPCNSQQVDFEAELAVIIGKTAKRVSPDEAASCLAGYTIMHDVSARDWQFRTGQWVSGKTFDTFGPCGPYLVTPDEIPDAHSLGISLKLNGKVMQQSNTSNLIFRVPVLISYLSQIFTLRPGDIISTGTPSGIGFARRPQVFLQDGDVVEITIDQIGTLRHSCVAERVP